MPSGKIGDADVPDFAAADQLLQRGENFFHRRFRVVTVELEEIDIVGAEAAQTAFYRADEVKTGGSHFVHPLAATEGRLRGDQNLVAAALDSRTQDFLRFASGVDVGAVEHGQAMFQADI